MTWSPPRDGEWERYLPLAIGRIRHRYPHLIDHETDALRETKATDDLVVQTACWIAYDERPVPRLLRSLWAAGEHEEATGL